MSREKGRTDGEHREKYKRKGAGALDPAQKQQPDTFVQPRLAHSHSHGEDSQDEENGVVHEGLGKFVG